MPRISRQNLTSKYFHVMVQGINKEKIFIRNDYKERYLRILFDYIEDSSVKITAYCVMDNHVHILIFTEDVHNMSKLMAMVNTKYAKYYNSIMNRCGYVYRDRFKSEMIMDRRHLQNCIKYIHNNPVKAGICNSAIEYKYSSYRRYFYNKMDKTLVCQIFGNDVDYKSKLAGDIAEGYDFLETNEMVDIEENGIKPLVDEYYEERNYKEKIYDVIMKLKNEKHIPSCEIMKALNIKKSTYYRILEKHK